MTSKNAIWITAAIAATITVSTWYAVVAQSQPSPGQAASLPAVPTTEAVAAIKVHKPGDVGAPIRTLQDRFTATNFAPLGLITMAYQLQRSELAGEPAWMREVRYDIDMKFDPANAPSSSIDAGWRVALRALLAQRFKLAVHREVRHVPAYSLVLNSPDGRLGRSLRPSTRVCDPTFQSNALPPGAQRPCGAFAAASNTVHADAISMPVLATFLSSAPGIQRMVVDRTGLSGTFDLDLNLSLSPTPAVDEDLASVFTALREQLGLTLDPSTAAIQVTVIDHVENLSED